MGRKKWKRRAWMIGIFIICISTAAYVTLKVFNDYIVFYLAPHDLMERKDEFKNKNIRVGGLVVEGSIQQIEKGKIRFKITDLQSELDIEYKGIIPNLFTDNQSTVIMGKFSDDGVFIAQELLAKHDENYMPKEVADSLKKSGKWQQDAVRTKSNISEYYNQNDNTHNELNKPPFDINLDDE